MKYDPFATAQGLETLKQMIEKLNSAPYLSFADFPPGKSALVVIGLINGFAREGLLKSDRVEKLISPIGDLMKGFKDFPVIMFADSHNNASPEFASYPVHCIAGSYESEIVEELQQLGHYLRIDKNSTNAFLVRAFQEWLAVNPQISTFIVAGDCTDICIYQFAVTLKAFFNEHNQEIRVIVPINAVNTFDLGLHNGDLMDMVALCSMADNGIEIVAGIR